MGELTAANLRYGTKHRFERRIWKRIVARGEAYCARCGQWIAPDGGFDLDHGDVDETTYLGASHRSYNRAAPHIIRTSRIW